MAASLGPFIVSTAELVRRPGHAQAVQVNGELDGLTLSDSWVPAGEEVSATVELEVVTDAKLTAVGEARTRWAGTCRRCLRDIGGELVVELSDVFEGAPSPDGDTYPLGADRVDLEPMVRDSVLLALPLAPLCEEACEGPAPADHPVGPQAEPEPDPRWAALGDLRFD